MDYGGLPARKLLRIGEAAKLVGVTPKTVRHYHKVGLLAEAARSEGGYRLYSAEDLLRLHRIRRLRKLGLSLGQVRAVIGEPEDERTLRAVLEALLAEVSAEIEGLEERRGRIRGLLAREELDVSAEASGDPYAIELMKERFGEHLPGIGADLLEQARKLWATLDAFEWPEGYKEFLEAFVRYYAERPDEYREMISLEERNAALAKLPEDSPEVERLVEDYARYFERSALREELSEAAWAFGPPGNVFPDLIASSLSPAQRRFFELMDERFPDEGGS